MSLRAVVERAEGSGMVMSIFDSDGTDPEQASGLVQPLDSLDFSGGSVDVLDTGWSPPDRAWAVADWGTTHREGRTGEALDARLTREMPDLRDADGDGLGDACDTDGELIDDEVGHRRAGRLVESRGTWGDTEPELYAFDVGIDGAGASAEEAAVHVVGEADGDVFGRRWY
jgi:hypothetical protein